VDEILAALKALEAALAEEGSVEGEVEELSEEELAELELWEKMVDACEEAKNYLKKREEEGARIGFWSCHEDTEKSVIEVELCDDNVVIDTVDIENVKRIIEKHGFTVNRVEIDAWSDEVVEVTLRFYVTLRA